MNNCDSSLTLVQIICLSSRPPLEKYSHIHLTGRIFLFVKLLDIYTRKFQKIQQKGGGVTDQLKPLHTSLGPFLIFTTLPSYMQWDPLPQVCLLPFLGGLSRCLFMTVLWSPGNFLWPCKHGEWPQLLIKYVILKNPGTFQPSPEAGTISCELQPQSEAFCRSLQGET